MKHVALTVDYPDDDPMKFSLATPKHCYAAMERCWSIIPLESALYKIFWTGTVYWRRSLQQMAVLFVAKLLEVVAGHVEQMITPPTLRADILLETVRAL